MIVVGSTGNLVHWITLQDRHNHRHGDGFLVVALRPGARRLARYRVADDWYTGVLPATRNCTGRDGQVPHTGTDVALDQPPVLRGSRCTVKVRRIVAPWEAMVRRKTILSAWNAGTTWYAACSGTAGGGWRGVWTACRAAWPATRRPPAPTHGDTWRNSHPDFSLQCYSDTEISFCQTVPCPGRTAFQVAGSSSSGVSFTKDDSGSSKPSQAVG